MSHVLIVFQANHEVVEQLALAVAVGAVEAGALIRLRRLSAPGAPEIGHKSYGKLTASDLEWSDAIVIGLEDASPSLAELGPLLDLFQDSGAAGVGSRPKFGRTFNAEGVDAATTAAELLVQHHLEAAGFVTIALSVAAASDLTARMKRVGKAAASLNVGTF